MSWSMTALVTGSRPVVGAKINHLIRALQRRLGLTSVVVTHDLASAFYVADRIAFLYEGKVRQVGTIEEIQNTNDPVVRQFIEGRAEIDIDAKLES